MATARALMVMPRSRSSSMSSSIWARSSRSGTVLVTCNMRSASVLLPWSMWAMMEKLRICWQSMSGTKIPRRQYVDWTAPAACDPGTGEPSPVAILSCRWRPAGSLCHCTAKGPIRLGGCGGGRRFAGRGRPGANRAHGSGVDQMSRSPHRYPSLVAPGCGQRAVWADGHAVQFAGAQLLGLDQFQVDGIPVAGLTIARHRDHDRLRGMQRHSAEIGSSRRRQTPGARSRGQCPSAPTVVGPE